MTDNRKQEMEIDFWLEEFLTGLLERTGLDIWVAEMDIDENTSTYKVTLDGKDKSRAIGRDGQMIESIQHLCVAAASNMGFYNIKIIIDVDGYRDRRKDKLLQEAKEAAERAISSREYQELKPMPAQERRLVHMTVDRIEGVKSESLGFGRERYVRLIPQH